MSPRIRVLTCVSILAVLTGCVAVSHSSKESVALASIADRSPAIQACADRDGVRAAFGEPLYGSQYWGFDLYRDEAEQSETVFAITPWPVPFAHLKDTLRRYTLITYDANSRIRSVESGIFRKIPDWRSASPIEDDFPSLALGTGGISLLLDRSLGDESLLAGDTARDAYFNLLRASSGCAAVIGTGSRGLGVKLSVDGRKDVTLPMRVPPGEGIEALVATRLPAGEHDLVFTSKYIGGSATRKLSCQPGDVTYFQVDITGTAKAKTLSFQIDQWDAMPIDFAGRPLVLVYDGEWRVEMEPGN